MEKEMNRFADFLTNLISKYANNLEIDQMSALEKIDDVLEQAGISWHEENEDILPVVKYLLGIILAVYKAFEVHFSIVEENFLKSNL